MNRYLMLMTLPFMLLGGRLSAQEATEAPAEKGPRFPALEAFEKRQDTLKIREKLLFERSAKEERDKNLDKIGASLQLIGTLTDSNEQVRRYVKLRRKILDVMDEIKDASTRQVELAGLIDAAMADGGLLPQVADYLKEARAQLHQMGLNQKRNQETLQKYLQTVQMGIKNVPPPESFTTRTGIVMRLVGRGPKAFYVSSTPISTALFDAARDASAGIKPEFPISSEGSPAKTGLTWKNAVTFSNWLSEQENAMYRLPDLEEIKWLNQVKYPLGCAVWSRTVWWPEDYEYQRMSERFAVSQYLIWDPQCRIAGKNVFGDLPSSNYETLGVIMVTSGQTGWQRRWDEILRSMVNEEP